MHTTNELLDAVKARHGLQSEYRLSQVLELSSQSAVSHYRKGRSRLDDTVAIRVADLLDLDPGYVLACVHAERSTDVALRRAWERLASLAHAGALAFMFAILSLFVGGGPDAGAQASPVHAAPAAAAPVTVCILCQLAKALLRRGRRWFSRPMTPGASFAM